jgi:GNAT superfamily N-acetyltransferase
VIAVRRATPTDLLAVVRLVDHVPDLEAAGLTDVQRSTWARALTTDNLRIYVALRGDHVVGTTSLLVMPHVTYGCHPTGFIEPMVVAAEHRRSGVGRRLAERAIADARDAGCRKLQVVSHKRHADDGAHDFYRSLGFVAEAEGFRLYI